MNEHSIATIINYCSNEYYFLEDCIKGVLPFSKQVIIPICDHFFDGTKENSNFLERTFKEFFNCQFILYPYLPEKVQQFGDKVHLMHSLSRLIGCDFLLPSIEYVLFLDVDEIVDGEKFSNWLQSEEYKKYEVMKLANYWYFRSEKYQAKSFEDSIIFAKRKYLNQNNLFHEDERDEIYKSLPFPKKRKVKSKEDTPMVHHYSWVRSKEEMIRKTKSWGHHKDKSWKELIEKEFEKEFLGKDFVHGYDFKEVTSFINIDFTKDPIANDEDEEMSNVKIISKKLLVDKFLRKNRFSLSRLISKIMCKK